MKRIRHIWRNTLRPWWYDYEWPVVGCLAVVVMVLGYIGFGLHLPKQEEKIPIECVDLLFRSAQLFVLQISVDPPMPWQLSVARILAPLVAGYTAIQAISGLLADQFQSFRLRFLHRHVVICGLGRKGLILARDFLEDKNRVVVVIEEDAENDYVAQCRDLGGIVLIGDATDTRMLCKARVARATHLFAFCGDDGENAEIAVHADELIPKYSVHKPTCILHVFDTRLCNLLHEREMDSSSADRMSIEFFNTYELGARVMLEEYPLCSPGDDPATSSGRLVIVGVGSLGESVLTNAARQWRAIGAAPGNRLRVTLVDRDAVEIAAKLKVRYPGLENVCDIDSRDMDVHSATFEQADFLVPDGTNGRPSRVFVCMDDDSLNFTAALVLASKGHAHNPTIVVRMARNGGLAVLLKDVDSIGGNFRHLRAFGLLDRACKPDQVLRGTDEILARGIHENYLRQQKSEGFTPETNPSMAPWLVLSKELKESNRKQAADIRTKLKTIHCSTAPIQDWDEKLFEFESDEIDLLARMEHDRWMEEKLQNGWSYAPIRDNTTKKHPCLVPYDKLPIEEQEKDISAVIQIPARLAEVGFRIHRASRSSE